MILTPGGRPLAAHALQAMLARDVTPAEVDQVLTSPQQTWDCRRSDRELRKVHQRGDIAVVVGSNGVVVTVLFHTIERWPAGQGRPSGRRMSKLARRRLEADLRRAWGLS